MSSYKTLLIPILNEILVKEIGEANIQPLEWTRVSPIKYKFWVDINDYTEIVTVEFEHIEDDVSKQFYFPQKYRNLDNVFNVGYVVSGSEIQFAKTDLKTLLTILSTVVDIVKHFIKDHPSLNGLYIKGTEKELGSKDISKKTNLYKAFIQQQLKNIPEFGSDYYREGFILVKKK